MPGRSGQTILELFHQSISQDEFLGIVDNIQSNKLKIDYAQYFDRPV